MKVWIFCVFGGQLFYDKDWNSISFSPWQTPFKIMQDFGCGIHTGLCRWNGGLLESKKPSIHSNFWSL